MKRRDGEKRDHAVLENIRFSDLRTTGMILKEIENELIPQTVSNTGRLSNKVLLGEWIPWNSGNEPVIEVKKTRWNSINFLIERTIGKKRVSDQVVI